MIPKPADVVIKQFGIQRSGTNYLKKLVQANFDPKKVSILPGGILGYKHETLSLDMLRESPKCPSWVDEIKIVVSVRDPMSWSLGYLRHIEKRKMLAFKSGLRVEVPEDHATLVSTMLNPKYAAWKKLCEEHPDRVMFMRFEDLLEDFQKALQSMAEHFDFAIDKTLVDIQGDICSNGQESSRRYDRRDYYLERRYLEDLSDETRSLIIKTTDWVTAAFFGY